MDGIINVYKEKGWTSFDVVAKLRGILGERKIGHTGTLDPAAEGVLVVCVGKATKLVDRITGTEKVYEAELQLGLETDTQDMTGQVLRKYPEELEAVTEEMVRRTIAGFVGSYDQVPPMYSAKKVAGKKLYEYARAGREVERKPHPVTIYDIRVGEIRLPCVSMRVTCGKGTYIRTLCSDIGSTLGCGGTMTSLKRTRVGNFRIGDSVKLDELKRAMKEGRVEDYLKPAICITEPTVATFGKFDGGHKGHQLIFAKMREIAAEQKLKTALMTFTVNPKAVIEGEERSYISTSEEHLSRLKNLGFDYVVEFPMTRHTAQMAPEVFLKEILVEGMHAKALVVGTDCTFGYQKGGDAAFLKAHEAEYGYQTFVIEKKRFLDEQGREKEISSTCIREEIGKGNVARAAALLGRYFALSGIVIRGKQIGSTVLGFPTANILPTKSKSIPKPGVYASRVLIGTKLYLGMTNVGTNPTVSGDNPLDIETHVLDFHGDLYDRKIRVEFVDRIRDQVKFDSLEALKAQLEQDVRTVGENYRYLLA